jgi:hypothetical protein
MPGRNIGASSTGGIDACFEYIFIVASIVLLEPQSITHLSNAMLGSIESHISDKVWN